MFPCASYLVTALVVVYCLRCVLGLTGNSLVRVEKDLKFNTQLLLKLKGRKTIFKSSTFKISFFNFSDILKKNVKDTFNPLKVAFVP